jgi:ureidoglycolate hydrolase
MTTTRTVRAEPRTEAAFAPFGQVLVVGDAVTELRDGEILNLDVLPYDRMPLRCSHLNRHQKVTEVLVVLARKATLLVVASASYDFSTSDHRPGVRAFLGDGSARVNLASGTWHWGPHPITDYGDQVSVDGTGLANDNEIAFIEPDFGVLVEVVV